MKQDAACVLTSPLLQPLVPFKSKLNGTVITLTAQRTVRLDSQRNAGRWRLAQSAFLVAITVNTSVESHERVVPLNDQSHAGPTDVKRQKRRMNAEC